MTGESDAPRIHVLPVLRHSGKNVSFENSFALGSETTDDDSKSDVAKSYQSYPPQSPHHGLTTRQHRHHPPIRHRPVVEHHSLQNVPRLRSVPTRHLSIEKHHSTEKLESPAEPDSDQKLESPAKPESAAKLSGAR